MPQLDYRPVVIYLNHASWWDPLVCLLLAREFLADRHSFAPIDAKMLPRYRFLRHLGFFPVESNTHRGALTFLRTSHAIIASSGNALWLTPQARFVDVRERPLHLQDGLGILAASRPDVAFVPLAIEYSFWTEPQPEVLVSFGRKLIPATSAAKSGAEWTEIFSKRLEETQDMLAKHSVRRQGADWTTLARGKEGIHPGYDAWRWLRAAIRAEKFSRRHQA